MYIVWFFLRTSSARAQHGPTTAGTDESSDRVTCARCPCLNQSKCVFVSSLRPITAQSCLLYDVYNIEDLIAIRSWIPHKLPLCHQVTRQVAIDTSTWDLSCVEYLNRQPQTSHNGAPGATKARVCTTWHGMKLCICRMGKR